MKDLLAFHGASLLLRLRDENGVAFEALTMRGFER